MTDEPTLEEMEDRRRQVLADPDSDPNPGDTLEHLDKQIFKAQMDISGTLERVRRDHKFHLLDPQQAYCVCGWLSEIPKGWWSVTLGDLSEQWQAHVEP